MRKLWKIIIAVILCFAILNLAWMIWRNVKYSRYTDGMKKTVFSQLTVPRYAREDEEGYDWMTMAISELSTVGAPSADLANRLNSLFGPCALVSIMAVCVAVANNPSKRFRFGVYCFAAMEWLCNVGYTCFPWVSDAPNSAPQNVMHLLVKRIFNCCERLPKSNEILSRPVWT